MIEHPPELADGGYWYAVDPADVDELPVGRAVWYITVGEARIAIVKVSLPLIGMRSVEAMPSRVLRRLIKKPYAEVG